MDIIERLIAAKDSQPTRGMRDLLSDAANEFERLREVERRFTEMKSAALDRKE